MKAEQFRGKKKQIVDTVACIGAIIFGSLKFMFILVKKFVFTDSVAMPIFIVFFVKLSYAQLYDGSNFYFKS